MPIFPRRSRNVADTKLVEHLSRQLDLECDKQANTQTKFIHPDKARNVVTREQIRNILGHFPWYEERYLTDIWNNMNLIICVLVYMNWNRWIDFKDLFYPKGGTLGFAKFTDADLPLNADILGLFPEEDKLNFLQIQHIFKPVIIEKDVHQRFDQRCPLPFLHVEQPPSASGSQGVVLKVTVAREYLKYSERTSNNRPEVMALKSIQGEEGRKRLNFETEKRALEGFKKSLTTHDRIMQSFASFVHGSDFKILSPWAEGGDLHHFLYEPHKALKDYPTRSRFFSPHALLTEAYLLAQALEFLHGGMRAQNTKRLRCAHQDLKPENILICFPANASVHDYPVGQWKIGDFGLAMIEEEVVAGTRVVPLPLDEQYGNRAPADILREASFTPAKRGQGPFQPPEVQSVDDARISTRRDVWSFGCILAMVLAFALGGPEEVFNQHQRRRTVDECFYHRPHRMRRSSMHPALTDAELKPDIKSWLDTGVFQLAHDSPSGWIRHCTRLITQLLDCSVLHRPEISLALRQLELIHRKTEVEANERWWNFDQNIDLTPEIVPDLAPQTTPRLVTRRDSLETKGDFVGVPTRSGGSSGPRSVSRGRVSSKSYKLDPSISFTKLTTPVDCQRAVIDVSGNVASIWSSTEASIYDLSKIRDDAILWRDEPVETAEHDASLQPLHKIYASKYATCDRVAIADPFIAVLERHSLTSYFVCIFRLERPGPGSFKAMGKVPLGMKPLEIAISATGVCMVRFPHELKLFSASATRTLTLNKMDFMGFAFSADGEYLALWESDNPSSVSGYSLYHSWTIFRSGTTFQRVGDTINYRQEEWAYQNLASSTLNPHFAAFHKYPRFVACDKQMNLYLIRADHDRARATRLGRTLRICTLLMLPNDEAFVQIREHSSVTRRIRIHKAEKCTLSSMGDDMAKKSVACGDLHRELVKNEHGFSVRSYTEEPGQTSFIVLEPSGLFVRKVLWN